MGNTASQAAVNFKKSNAYYMSCSPGYLMTLSTLLFALFRKTGLLILSAAAAELLNKAIIAPADQVFTVLLGLLWR